MRPQCFRVGFNVLDSMDVALCSRKRLDRGASSFLCDLHDHALLNAVVGGQSPNSSAGRPKSERVALVHRTAWNRWHVKAHVFITAPGDSVVKSKGGVLKGSGIATNLFLTSSTSGSVSLTLPHTTARSRFRGRNLLSCRDFLALTLSTLHFSSPPAAALQALPGGR